jgi:hypothetical protein
MTQPKRKGPGRPTLASRDFDSVRVQAPKAEIEKWRRTATRAERTLNGWIREQLNAATEKKP